VSPRIREEPVSQIAPTGVCAFLASDDAAYITGQTIFVDGSRRPRVRVPSLTLKLLVTPRFLLPEYRRGVSRGDNFAVLRARRAP
jgi:hypothetical protein